MTIRLDGQVVVVTGGGRGIGRAHAVALARRGAHVIVNDLPATEAGTAPSAADTVVDAICADGGSASANYTDVSRLDTTHGLIEGVVSDFGRIDAIVANAGITGIQRPFDETPSALLEQMVGLNLLGPWGIAQAAWPHFRAQSYGRLVFTMSGAGLTGMSGNSAYAMVKAGLLGLTRTLAVEGGEHNIVVNALAPVAYTRLSAHEIDSERSARLAEIAPPEAIAPAAVALVSREWTRSGDVYSVGGGHIANLFIGQTRGLLNARSWEPEVLLERLEELLDRSAYVEIREPGSTSGYVLSRI